MINCNKITKISNLLTNRLTTEMDSISNTLVNKLDFNTSLTLMKNLHFLTLSNSILFNHLEMNLLSKLKSTVIFPNQLVDCISFSNNITLNVRLMTEIMSHVHYKSPLFKSKEIIDIDATMKHNKYTNIKREVLKHQQDNDTFFSKERINNKKELLAVLLNSLQIENLSTKENNIEYDKENNIIETNINGRKIILIEICDVSSNGFKQFQNNFNKYRPKVVLINNEPLFNRDNNTFINKFNDKKALFECLKDKSYRVRNISSEVFKNSCFSICESAALYSLCNNSTVEYFDIPILDYLITFAKHNTEDFNNLKPIFKIINISNLLFWIGYNAKEGCNECNKSNNFMMEPLSLEFLVSRELLPNYDSINKYRVNRIYDALNDTNQSDNIIVYSNNIHLDLKILLESINEKVIINGNNKEDNKIVDNETIKNMAYGIQFKTNTLDYLSTETYSLLNSLYMDINRNKVNNKFDLYLKQDFAHLNGIDTELKLIMRKLSIENNNRCSTEKFFSNLINNTNTLI